MEKFDNLLDSIEKDKEILITKSDNVSIYCRSKRGPKKIVKIPVYLNPSLSFLAGIIIGDGHLSKSGFKITVEMVSKELLEVILDEFQNTFRLNLKLKKDNDRRLNRKQRWIIEFHSKAIWSLFNIVFDIPYGKKSEVVKVPKIISNSTKDCCRNFILGYFLADGGFKKNVIAFCSISKRLIYEVQDLLSNFGISSSVNKFKNKKFNREFFELSIRGGNIDKFINIFPETKIKTKTRGSPSLVDGAGREPVFQLSGDA